VALRGISFKVTEVRKLLTMLSSMNERHKSLRLYGTDAS
jgi:hypothetical protein